LPYLASTLPIFVIFCLFILIALAKSSTADGIVWEDMTPMLIIGVIGGPLYFVYSILVYRFVRYVITDKRTLIQKGIIGRDFTGIEHDAVTSTSVYVGVADKLFGKNSGTVKIVHSGSSRSKYGSPVPTALMSVTDPYAVYQLFNKTSHDVRTDVQYPNAMRPENNPGYKTDYKL
jgi:hypothetical protein